MGELVAAPALERPGARRARARRGGPGWLVAPALALLVPAFFVPTLFVLVRSITTEPVGVGRYGDVFGSSLIVSVFGRSVMIAAIVTAVSLAIGVPYAVVAVRSGPRLRALLLGAVASSLFLSVIVRAYAWLALLDRNGPLVKLARLLGFHDANFSLVHNLAGVVIGLAQYGVPFVVLACFDVMRRLDSSYERAAATLGAGPVARWTRINLPLLMPGIAAGAVIVFISTLGYYIIPAILGGPGDLMIGQLIANQISTTLNWGLGAAISSVLLVVTLVALVAFQWLSRAAARI